MDDIDFCKVCYLFIFCSLNHSSLVIAIYGLLRYELRKVTMTREKTNSDDYRVQPYLMTTMDIGYSDILFKRIDHESMFISYVPHIVCHLEKHSLHKTRLIVVKYVVNR